MVTGLEDIIKVGARLLDFYYMSNSFISDPSVILDSSAECDTKSDIRGPSTQASTRASALAPGLARLEAVKDGGL
jgi:hypothetical protein